MAEGSGERSPWRVACEVGLSMFGFMHKNRMLSPSHYDMAMFEMKIWNDRDRDMERDTKRDCVVVFDRPMITVRLGNMVCMDRVCYESVRMIYYSVLNTPEAVIGRADSSPDFILL